MRSVFRAFLPCALTAASLALGGAPAQAQSLLATRGLGLVVEPADARAFGMGGIPLGLTGNEISWANPAEAVGIPVPGFKLAFQYDDFASTYGGRESEGSTARFPLIAGAFPIGERIAVSVGLGGYLDQNWAVQRLDTLLVGTDSTEVQDRFTSVGGVSRARIGAGYRVAEQLSVAVGFDVYTGGVERAFGRRFAGDVEPGCCTTEWNYSGLGFLAGADWRPSEAARLSASVSRGGTLNARTDDSLSVDRSFELPMTLMAGGSARVANDLLLGASAEWSGWSSLDDALSTVGGARDGWAVRGGVEWDAIMLGERAVPIRIGGRTASLPFRWDAAGGDDEWIEERALTGGLGVILAGGAARTDLALERGTRGGAAAGLDESFWRMSFSFIILGR